MTITIDASFWCGVLVGTAALWANLPDNGARKAGVRPAVIQIAIALVGLAVLFFMAPK